MIDIAHNKRSVLLIEDDLSVGQMLAMLLKSRGYGVDLAISGQEALSKISKTTDLILLDLALPDTDGMHLCQVFRQNSNTQDIPIIILSAKLLSSDVIEGLYMGADDYLTKPFEYEELLARMEAVVRRRLKGKDARKSYTNEPMLIAEIKRIIEKEAIVPFFQPIFLLKKFHIYGLEALSRPETTTVLSNPELLFKMAIQYGFYHELEFISWKKALECAAQHIEGKKLFLNCNPYFVEGPKFLKVKSLFEDTNINPENVVLEVTERSAIMDFKVFYENLNSFRDYGLKFAVDDVGGGYASLEAIVETHPEIVKIDRHIINELDKDPYKRSIVKFIVAFCRENNILSVAEGVESQKALEMIVELGVDAGQGYYLCKPMPNIDFAQMANTINYDL